MQIHPSQLRPKALIAKKEDAKNASPDTGFHHPVRNGKKRGNSMGSPCVQRLCSADYLMLCWVLVSSVTWQSKKPAWRNWQRNCLVSRRLQVRFLSSALGCGTIPGVSQPQNPGQKSSESTTIAHRVAKQAGVALGTQ